MRPLAAVDESILFFLNHLGAEGPARHVAIRLVATGIMYALAGIVLHLIWKGSDRRRLLQVVLLSVIAAFLIGKTLNHAIVRDRPFIVFPEQVRRIDLIVRPASFPSIHAVTAFGMVGAVLFALCRTRGYIMLALALPMLAARVAAGVHWPSDVVGGAAIGLLAAGAVAVWDARRHADRGDTVETDEPPQKNPDIP